jgi:esterase
MIRLFFREIGNGPPLIILHGLYGSSDNWVSIAKSLTGFFTVYLPDQRNHGQSFHSQQHNYQYMTDDLHQMVTELGFKKFFLAGHSMGGKTSMFFALKWPEMIEGLLVADISPFTPDLEFNDFYEMHINILNAILSIDTASLNSRKEAELLLSKKIVSKKIREFILKNLEQISPGSYKWRLNASALLDNLDAIIDGLPRPVDQTNQVSGFPVVFLKATESSYLPESDFKDIYKLFPAAEIRTVENSGHWINVDRPDAVRNGLLSLLNG